MIPDLWYKNAIIYSLSLDAFQDTDIPLPITPPSNEFYQ